MSTRTAADRELRATNPVDPTAWRWREQTFASPGGAPVTLAP